MSYLTMGGPVFPWIPRPELPLPPGGGLPKGFAPALPVALHIINPAM